MKIKSFIAATLIVLPFTLFSYISDNKESDGVQQDKSKVIPLAQRIGHTDQDKARPSQKVHDGTGTLYLQTQLNRDAIYCLNFMHHGPLMPKSSIGHHFHNDTDEMFLILDGDCEFTVNGHTSLLPGPVGVPCPSGNSHAVYNPSPDKPVDWVNFNVRVSTAPATGGFPARGAFNFSADPTGTFNLGDDRASVQLSDKPNFVHTGKFTKESLRPVVNMTGGKDTVLYRRALGPSVFKSNWAFVDHLLIPSGSSVGRHFHSGVEEVYLVIKGRGVVNVNDETAEIVKGDAVPIRAGEIHSFEPSPGESLEMIIYGVALEKGKLDVTAVK
ncbi:MAG: cupin domain-containing protein [Bacteroidales bacterium]|nr:cupin domain-containing protein [Bacteroidales bacterium]